MKSLFHKWLLFFVVLAFGLTFGLSWYLHRKEAKENALRLLEVNLTDVAGRGKRAENNLQTITEMSVASAIAKTRASALLIKEKPSMLRNSLKPVAIPQSPDYKFSAEIIPAAETGGNMCDVFKINKDYLALHVDPIHKHFHGHAGFINGPVMPRLGASSGASFIQLPLQLNKDDKLYFYSGDIIEVQNAQGEKYGRNRLPDVIYSSGSDAQEVVKSIRRSLTEFTGSASLNADTAVAV